MSQKNFGSKIFVKKIVGTKDKVRKKSGPKEFRSKKYFGQKKFGPKKMWSKIIKAPKNWVQKVW